MPLDYVLRDPVDFRNGGLIVRLADSALKSVGFIAAKDPRTGEWTYGGTGFFVKFGGDEGEARQGYLITAKHVAQEIEGSEFILRMGAVKQSIPEARWYYSESDASVDVAVTPFNPPKDAGVARFPQKHFLTKFKIGTKRIGQGDQTYAVGLYRLHPGEAKNRVVVHTGHIAMMPDSTERFSVRNWPALVEGYAIEAQTLDGLSGSPVFVRRSIQVQPTEHTGTEPLAYGATFLLGLWMASWEGIPDKELSAELQKQGHAAGRGPSFKVPVGMGVVVPAYHIFDVLNHSELRAARREAFAAKMEECGASLDSALPRRAENPRHKEDFTALLNAAARKKPQAG